MIKANRESFEVVLSEAANNDLKVIHDFYLLSASETVANQQISKIENIFQSLQFEPERGLIPKELKTVGIKHYKQLLNKPFRVIYSINQQHVRVGLVLHQKQSIQKALSRRILM